MKAKLTLLLILSCVALVNCRHDEPKNCKESLNEKAPNDVKYIAKYCQLDLRVDANRDGNVDLTGDSDAAEDSYTDAHGAIFLANIDDDENTCAAVNISDSALAACNDAADEFINGEKDLLDMARIHLLPLSDVPDGTSATIIIEPSDKVRLFWLDGSEKGKVVESEVFAINAAMLKEGMEFALEGIDIIRDNSWNGLVSVSVKYTSGVENGESLGDTVVLKEAPIILSHHLNAPKAIYATDAGIYNSDMTADLDAAAKTAGISNGLNLLDIDDIWTQDLFEAGTMSMPGPGGKAHVIQVNVRTAAFYNEESHPRSGSQIIYTVFRGEDVAGAEAYKKHRTSDDYEMDSLNSTGNLEVFPPYTHNGKSYPLGRIFIGSIPSFHVDKFFMAMLESQGVQPPIKVDTSWLAVGHVDEIFSVTKMDNERGWGLLANDARLAREMLQKLVDDGLGETKMFVGCETYLNDDEYNPQVGDAAISVAEVLDDEYIMAASQEAAVKVDEMLEIIKNETGLTKADIIPVPFLHEETGYGSIAYMPGMVNGVSLGDGHFAAPDPHGPEVNGKDIFKKNLEESLTKINTKVYWVEDFSSYHVNMGEIHCGSNIIREAGTAERWWEKK